MASAESGAGAPSAFYLDCEREIAATRGLGPILDLACGRGRHALAAGRAGLDVIALDRNANHLAELRAASSGHAVAIVEADLEGSAPPDLGAARFGAVLVFRYLHRPLTSWIESLLAPGGVLVYETFTLAQRELGWGPSRDAFLLSPGELPSLFPRLEVERFEEGRTVEPRPAETARLLARRPR